MTHGPEHHIEHAEHAAHAAHDGFNKQVTMSIAIVAAVLACVTMLAHRAHNDTLRLQGEALELQSKANIKSTETANKWAYYQGKNTFNLLSEITLDTLKVVAVRDENKKDFKDIVKRYEDTVEYYSGDKNSRSTAKKKKKSAEPDATEVKGQLKKIEKEARGLAKQTDDLMKASETKLNESHVIHAKADRFDYGELGLQLGVVLCSLAILTRGRGFWLAGIISSVVGALVALTGLLGLFMGHH
ncbi:MAG: DUF4337 family protein [Planctomycetes bacterium]|jgi:predicted transcriptional regulator|nr:DUF4337 family protein [Planctomycetota bacterium]